MEKNLAASDSLIRIEILDRDVIMSYIDKALGKARQEKDSCYAAYSRIIGPQADEERQPVRRPFRAGVLILLFFMLVAAAFLFGFRAAEKPPATPAVPAKDLISKESLAAANNHAAISGKPSVKNDPAAKSVKEKQKFADTKVILAQAIKRQEEGKLAQARALYRRVIRREANNWQALNNLGVIYLSQKNYRRAALRFHDALAVQPDSVDVIYNLACLYAQTNELTRSLQYLQRAVKLNPEARQWAKRDHDLTVLKESPDFSNLLNAPED